MQRKLLTRYVFNFKNFKIFFHPRKSESQSILIILQWQEYRATNLQLVDENPLINIDSPINNEIVQKMKACRDEQRQIDTIRRNFGLYNIKF